MGVLAVLVTGLSLAVLTTWPSFSAEFGPIDDHEPLRWMGADGRLGLSEYFTTLYRSTELAEWGSVGRFRPAYYAVRVGQAVVLGGNPSAWYVTVAIAYGLTCALLGLTMAMWLRAAVGPCRRYGSALFVGSAAICTLLAAGMRAWSGIVGRLGPSEQLGLLCVSAAGLALTARALGGSRRWWILAVLAMTGAAFAKESFVTIAIVGPIIGEYAFRQCDGRRIDRIAGWLMLSPSLVLALILGPHLLSGGSDVYGRPVGSSRFRGAVSWLTTGASSSWYLAAMAALLAWALLAWRSDPARDTWPLCLFGLVASGIAVIAADAVFYGGAYWAQRYYAVSDLMTLLLFIGALAMTIGAARRASLEMSWIGGICLLLLSLLTIWQVVRAGETLTDINSVARRQAAESILYRAQLDELESIVNERSGAITVVVSSGGDYEPTFALLNDIARWETKQRRAFLITVPPGDRSDGLLELMAKAGVTGDREWHIDPLSQRESYDQAACVFINRPPFDIPNCEPDRSFRIRIVGM